MQKLEILNSTTEIILLYCVMGITDANLHNNSVLFDLPIATVILTNIGVHLFFLVKSTYINAK